MQRKIAIMQPYAFPYIGYFQLTQAVDHFIFYDDVNFVKKGWINRNRILNNKQALLFTIPIHNASQNRRINETEIAIDAKWLRSFGDRLKHSYRKAPHFDAVMQIALSPFTSTHKKISEIAITSIVGVLDYLDLRFCYSRSSEFSPESVDLERSDRLIHISKKASATHYINALGGKSLYSKEYFQSHELELSFLEPKIENYSQSSEAPKDFIPSLSIIDVLMFNSKERVIDMLSKFELS